MFISSGNFRVAREFLGIEADVVKDQFNTK
jgi:hypothetical protein